MLHVRIPYSYYFLVKISVCKGIDYFWHCQFFSFKSCKMLLLFILLQSN